MQKHIIYITTDANRMFIEAGYCQDITLKVFEMQQSFSTFLSSAPKFCRIVHTEEFNSFESAQKRKNELNNYTHTQKQRLIRKYNPNWLGINPINAPVTKKAVVYA